MFGELAYILRDPCVPWAVAKLKLTQKCLFPFDRYMEKKEPEAQQ